MNCNASSLAVRRLTDADFDRWLPLWKSYQTFYGVSLAPESTQAGFRRFLDENEPMHCALAVQGAAVVGFVHFIEHRSSWTIGDYCYLQDLYVDQASRGLGIGRALIEHVYAHAKNQGCARVYWLTQENNAAARRLYDQVADNPGFIQYRKIL